MVKYDRVPFNTLIHIPPLLVLSSSFTYENSGAAPMTPVPLKYRHKLPSKQCLNQGGGGLWTGTGFRILMRTAHSKYRALLFTSSHNKLSQIDRLTSQKYIGGNFQNSPRPVHLGPSLIQYFAVMYFCCLPVENGLLAIIGSFWISLFHREVIHSPPFHARPEKQTFRNWNILNFLRAQRKYECSNLSAP